MHTSTGLEDSVFLVGFSLDVITCNPSKIKFLAALSNTIYIAACGFDQDESAPEDGKDNTIMTELDQKAKGGIRKINSSTNVSDLAIASSSEDLKEKKVDSFGRGSEIEFADSAYSDMPIEGVIKHDIPGKSVTIVLPVEPMRRKTISRSGHSSKHSAISDWSNGHPTWDPIHPFSYPVASLPILCTASDDLSLEHFSDVKHIADGSNSNVFLATYNEERVIIKMIKENVQSDVVAIHEFDIEHGILCRLNHPNIIKLKGAGRLPRRFIVLEYIEGGSLYTILDQNQAKSGLAHRLFRRPTFTYMSLLMKIRELADTFRYLHYGLGDDVTIIHRDLKPDNVGFTMDGTLKLFDFGLCTCVKRRQNQNEYYEMTGNTGSLRYMAPEVALKRSYGEKVDVYSFGILVWQMARDKTPFQGFNKESFIRNVVAGGRRPKLDKSWPVRFSTLLQKCWHTDPSKRPSFQEIYEEFHKLIDDESKRGTIWRVNHKNPGKWQTQAHESTWF